MLYYLFDYLNKLYNPPGFDAFQFLTTRSALSALTALILCAALGPPYIKYLKTKQIGEAKKEDGPKFHWSKAGTPTMGGLLILFSILISTILWSDIKSPYIYLALFSLTALGVVGFFDDYLKVVKKFPKGLIARYKLLGQFIVGIVVGSFLYWHSDFSSIGTITTAPFLKDVNFDYGILYIPAIIFIITATSNAVNLTDGLDGLAIGCIIVVMMALGIMAYVSGNIKYAGYLNIMYLPGSGELTIFITGIIGAGLGFMWYNCYPAQVFMGDSGSLALGGALGVICLLIRKELLLPLLGGIFFMETVSVIIQRLYFKYTKKKYGEGKRVFKMAPIHHHFEMLGWPEPKIVNRFYIITIILAILSLMSFKIR